MPQHKSIQINAVTFRLNEPIFVNKDDTIKFEITVNIKDNIVRSRRLIVKLPSLKLGAG
jgi:hypothetical protein